jgi:UDP-glucose:(heptosyl)LPS alpha-1,3-glucosyltransferase
LKIALVIEHYRPAAGGAERWTDRHARMLLERGHDVHLFAMSFTDAPRGAVRHQVGVERRGLGGLRLAFPEAVARMLEPRDHDIVHDMGAGWHADVITPHAGIRPAIYRQRSRLLMPPERWLRPLAFHVLPRYRRFRALERRQFDGDRDRTVIALSDLVRRHLLAYHDVPESRIRVIHNGIDSSRFRPPPDPAGRARLRRLYGLRDRTVSLFAAHDFRYKGLDTVLAALGRLVRRKAPVGLFVLGSGATKRYRRIAHRYGCFEHVRFAGAQADPVPFYQAADVCVHPTMYDPCSLAVLEAMACGLPVITSAWNGAAEVFPPDMRHLILDDPRDARALTGLMEPLTDGERRRAAGAAMRRAMADHTERDTFERVCDVYRDIVARRDGERPRPAVSFEVKGLPGKGSGIRGQGSGEVAAAPRLSS